MKKMGKVKDAQGLKGEIYVIIFSKDVSWVKKLRKFYLMNLITNDLQTFQVESCRPHKDGLVIRIPSVNNRTEAEKLRGLEFHIDEDLLISAKGETIYLSEILNFSVVESQLGPIGTVKSFTSNGPQDILVVSRLADVNKDFLIPFIEDFIVEISFSQKYILMKLPQGLLEINEN